MDNTFLNDILSYVLGEFSTTIVNFLLSLVVALIVLLVGLKIARKIIKRVFDSKRMQARDKSVVSFLRSLTTVALYMGIVIIVASIIGVPMATISAAIASAGLAIGLALQGGLANLAGGVMILLFKPFKIGDVVSNGTNVGTVTDISLFYTTLVTADNRKIVIPNGVMSNSAVTNITAFDTRRVDLEFTISYSSDIVKAREIILKCANALPNVLKDPASEAPLIRQDASALVLQARIWCKTDDYWDVFFNVNESVKNEFDKNGIEIPFPQMDLHFNPKVLQSK